MKQLAIAMCIALYGAPIKSEINELMQGLKCANNQMEVKNERR